MDSPLLPPMITDLYVLVITECGIKSKNSSIIQTMENTYFKQKGIQIRKMYTASNRTFWHSKYHGLYVNGNNEKNECGISCQIHYLHPKQIKTPTLVSEAPVYIKHIAGSYCHTIILADNIGIENIVYIILFWTRSSIKMIPNDVIAIIYDYFCDKDKSMVYSSKYYGEKKYNYGQNGDGSNNFKNKSYNGFHRIPFFKGKRITHIAVSGAHSIFVENGNILWCAGANQHGKSGFGRTKIERGPHPKQNTFFKGNDIKIKDICGGSNHYLVLGDNGICYAMGWNSVGQCGIGIMSEHKRAKSVRSPTAIDLSTEYKIIKIKTGEDHNWVLSDYSEHILFGDNRFNQCTLRNEIKKNKMMYLLS